jgi:DNA-binding SARP family transcriptional activator/tetratricopeptide (TPR) repeat protein
MPAPIVSAMRLQCAMHPHPVRLFGRPELDLDGRHKYFTANHVDQFLAYLAFRAGWVTRDELVFLFWSNRVDAVGRRNLRKLLHRARQEVGGVETESDRVRWLVATDVQAWCEALDLADVRRALALSRGPLLEGLDLNATVEFGDWLETERSQTQRRLSDAVVERCEQLEHDAPEEAIALAAALSALDPLDERAVQCSLRALAHAGRADTLEATFRTFADRLALELGGEPLAATRALTRPPGPDPGADDAASQSGVAWPPEVHVPWGTTSFVGRRVELAQLDECLSAALAGHGGVVAVEGEAGVGKTRLIEQFLSRAPAGVARFAARCFERDLSAPLDPIRTALGVWDETTPARPVDDLRLGTTEPGNRGHVLRGLTARLLAEGHRHGGAILFIDDLQWADAATLEFLSYAAVRVQEEPVLMLVSHRREDRDVLERWRAQLSERRAIRGIAVGRFDGAQTRSLVAEVFDGEEADLDRFAAFVHDESEGNPFYVLEYLRWLRDGGAIELDEAGRISAASWGRIEHAAVPESIRSLISARYWAVGEHAREVLDLAAVIGRGFDFALLEVVAEREPFALWSTMEPLLAAGLLVSWPGGTYAFSHDKLRETVYESLGPPVRRSLHARVAAALQGTDAGGAELAHHFLRAELWRDAYASLLAAARSAEAETALEVALQGYQRMLTLLDRLDEPDRRQFEVLLAIERLLEMLGRQPEWIDTIERLSDIARRVGDPRLMAEAALKRMAVSSVLDDTAGAKREFAEAEAIFAETDDAASQARAYRDVAYLAWARGDYPSALAASSEAARIFERLGHRRELAATAENIAQAHRWLGNEDHASRWSERAASIYDEEDDVLADYVRLDARSWIHRRRGDHAAAAAVLERLLPICVRMEKRVLLAGKHMNLGKAYLALDRIEDALAQFESAARLGVNTGDPRHEGYPLMSAGAAHERLQDPETAARYYSRAARLLEVSYATTQVTEDQIGQGDALILHGVVARRRLGDTEAARASLISAQRIMRFWDDPDRLSRIDMELGALYWSTGELHAAAEAFGEAVTMANRHGMVDREIAGLASLGVVYRDLGNVQKGIELGRAAVERMEGREDPRGTAALLTSLAASYHAAGHTDAERACLERALALRADTGDPTGAAARQALPDLEPARSNGPL